MTICDRCRQPASSYAIIETGQGIITDKRLKKDLCIECLEDLLQLFDDFVARLLVRKS